MAQYLLSNEQDTEIAATLEQIRKYLEAEIVGLKKQADQKDADLKACRKELEMALYSLEGKTQLINKLAGDIGKLQNDIDWYKRTYEQRSFWGTIREKISNRARKSG